MTEALTAQHCRSDAPLLDDAEAEQGLKQLPHWQLDPGRSAIARQFRFKDFHRTMAFVNAVAWIAHREEHHPDLEVGYNRCTVRYSTHSAGGLTRNDLICAARIDALEA